jgi:hypothetical protein
VFPRFKSAAFAGCILVAIVLTGWIGYSRTVFGIWNPLQQPSRIDYCGRRYYPGALHLTRAEIVATGNGLGVFPIEQVAISPAGAPIYAKPLPESVRHQVGNPALPCNMAVYLKDGTDDYLAYGISGGP